jgi:hypothetical protein
MNRSSYAVPLVVVVAMVGGWAFVHGPAVGHAAPVTVVARNVLTLGLTTVGQTISYGGVGNSSVSSSWRALPSEARFNQQASGLMPSERREAVMATGNAFFTGGAAEVTQRTPGTLRYSNPYARQPTMPYRPPVGSISPTWTAPARPLISSTRPLGTTSLAQPFSGGGSIHYGGARLSPLARPVTASSYPMRSSGTLAPLTRPIGGSMTTRPLGGGYGTIRYGY